MGFLGFLDQLGSSLMGQINMTEGTPRALGEGGKPFASLGNFAKEIDRSAHRSYLETGAIRNVRPRIAEVWMQEPDMTVVVKKRMFSSLVENYRMDMMDDQEKLFVRATKKLFYNKCRAIAAYERLTKIDRIGSQFGFISDIALPMIFGLVDILNASPLTSSLIGKEEQAILDKIHKVKSLSDPNFITSWIVDKDLPYVTDTGDGTGSFELTLVQSARTTSSVKFGGGSAELTIEDPYKLMLITNDDIDQAITDASNRYEQSNFFKLTEFQLGQTINDLKRQFNQVRLARGASPIHFFVNERTLLYKKVKAVVDLTGTEVIFRYDAGSFGANLFSFDNESVSIDPVSTEGLNGIKRSNNEAGLFKQIIHNMYLLMGLKHTTDSEVRIFNEETNVVRKKMRLHYALKPIIQPMDVVNVFINSKTSFDSKIVRGMNFSYDEHSLINKIDETIGNIESAIDDIRRGFGGSPNGQDSFIETEKNAIAGAEFPLWLWTLMRNDFTRQNAGTCTFVGPVESSSHSYSGGKYTLSVSCNDNVHYLKMGQANIKPSVMVYNGALYDPLTPFDLDFDVATGFIRGETPQLLEENLTLLNSGCVRAKLGRNRGKSVNEKIYSRTEIEDIAVGLSPGGYRRKFYDPDGFVYRWKEGIGSLVVYGEPNSSTIGSFNNDISPQITQSPFAGQDVMNVLSLLVTGQPYNFNTFIQNAVKSGKLNRDDLFNKGNTTSFYRGLTRDLSEKNATWGNFIPFKKLIINEKGYNYIIREEGEFGLITLNGRLKRLLEERAKKTDQLLSSSPTEAQGLQQYYTVGEGGSVTGSSDDGRTATDGQLIGQVRSLSAQINTIQKDFINTLDTIGRKATNEGSIGIFGNDITYDPSIISEGDSENETKRRRNRSEFRKRINNLTLRRLWKVKANDDSNLFIVDDSYDKNYNIQAFEQGIIDIALFDSTFSDIGEQVNKVKDFLGLEVFADSQGNIQARPPQYNRMPKTVFRDILQKKAEKGIQIFPKYLESLFFNRVDGFTDQLEIIEDKIRLYGAALGYTTDSSVRSLLSGLKGNFTFVTLSDGNIRSDIKSLFGDVDPEFQTDRYKNGLEKFSDDISEQLKRNLSFTILDRIRVINNNEVTESESQNIATRIGVISDRLRKEKGVQNVPSDRFSLLSSTRRGGSIKKLSQVEILKGFEVLSDLVSDRRRVMTSLANSLRNLTQGISVNARNSDSAQSLLLPNIYQSEDDVDFPELLEHMIEDESVDDFGQGAGKRYIIKDSHIKSFTIREKGPDFTAVNVTGKLARGLVNWPSEAALGEAFGSSGNALGTALAVDFDMWRMYGWRNSSGFEVPFFSNPVTQCAPYAVFLLNLARRNVFTANITVIGNEFIQPGEVYYLEDYDMLFYSESVTQNFTYGSPGNFNTTIELSYGRSPGEYIPTHLDIIGNALYTNRFQADLATHDRFDRADDSTHVATIIYDNSSIDSDAKGNNLIEQLMGSLYGEQNRKSLGNILMAAGGWFPGGDNYGKKLGIELRVYKNTNNQVQQENNDWLEYIANTVVDWIFNPAKKDEGLAKVGSVESSVKPSERLSVDRNDISVEIVDLNSEIDDDRSPSQEAWAICRSIINSGAEGSDVIDAVEFFEFMDTQNQAATQEQLQQQAEANRREIAQRMAKVLCNYIVDIWVTFSDPVEVLEEDGTKIQSAQLKNEDIARIKEARIKSYLTSRSNG
jgi:hypothetical protein